MTQKIKKYILILLLAQLFLSYNLAFAQNENYIGSGVEAQIKEYLCAPNDVPVSQTSYTNGVFTGQQTYQDSAAAANNNSGVLYKCINQVYKFAIVIASVVSVFFIVIAGYIYISSDGDQEAVSKAKNILASSIASIVILLVGYVLLKALNPDLVEFHSVQPPSVVMQPGANTPPGSGSGGSIDTSVCKVDVGACNLSQISACPKWDAKTASGVCYIESGGGNVAAKSGSDKCTDGASWSIGLFQINILAHAGADYMPAACKKGIIEKNGSGPQGNCLVWRDGKVDTVCLKRDCRVIDQDAYKACVDALSVSKTNIDIACTLYGQRGWQPWTWTYNNVCKAGANIGNTTSGAPVGSTCAGTAASGGILLLGDSLMDGMKTTLYSKGSINKNTFCKSGDGITGSSAAYINSQQTALKSGPPDIAIISLGTNNYAESANTLKSMQSSVINSLKAANVKRILWVGPPQFTQPQKNYTISKTQNETLNTALKEGAAANGICYYDTYSGSSLYLKSPSDIHEINYASWANSVWSYAQSNCR